MSTAIPTDRLAYDDLAAPADLQRDCRETRDALRPTDAIAAAARRPAPSLDYADQRRDLKPQIEVSEAAARLAAAIYQD
ncbi:hypothetical protein [Nocardioides zeae]|uniref:Uncharacterized protein n=1 Tax=Nocardioides zeae TaxID=1457234 RepID=A0A6P0HLT6_9ACTN|nr:hypothetical protein [Nocardioides zeae]NEN79642.1 hypothetical protein [Nocardioides zeae]